MRRTPQQGFDRRVTLKAGDQHRPSYHHNSLRRVFLWDSHMRKYVITASMIDEETPLMRYHLKDTFEPDKHVVPFRLLDADGVVHYYGLYIKEVDFEAQDAHEPFCGCTTTEYFDGTNWKEL